MKSAAWRREQENVKCNQLGSGGRSRKTKTLHNLWNKERKKLQNLKAFGETSFILYFQIFPFDFLPQQRNKSAEPLQLAYNVGIPFWNSLEVSQSFPALIKLSVQLDLFYSLSTFLCQEFDYPNFTSTVKISEEWVSKSKYSNSSEFWSTPTSIFVKTRCI